MSDAPTPATEYPPGEYAIVELLGHQTLVGRITEVERFGTKLMCIEPLFNGQLLPPTYQGGASIYRFTPCAPRLAFEQQPREPWQLPAPIRATLPVALLGNDATLVVTDGLEDDPGDDRDR